MPSFSAASEAELATCHPDLQRLFRYVIEGWDCKVLQGKRSEAEAADTVANGTSHTNHSKHVYPLGEPSRAADVAPYPVDWKDAKRFYAFAGYVLACARHLGVTIRWGGDWDSDHDLDDQSFFDLPHFELVGP
jgi:peptidoglycan L-alanyl-D-glutamate endopeptidase CwlK